MAGDHICERDDPAEVVVSAILFDFEREAIDAQTAEECLMRLIARETERLRGQVARVTDEAVNAAIAEWLQRAADKTVSDPRAHVLALLAAAAPYMALAEPEGGE